MARRDVTLGLVGLLNVLVGGVVIWGGGQEAYFYWPDAPLNVAVGSTGALAGVLVALSGAGLWLRRSGARSLAFAAGGGTVIVHAVGMLFGFIGVPGLLIGVAYPVFVMVWVVRSGTGTPGLEERPDERRGSGEKGRDLRMTSVVA